MRNSLKLKQTLVAMNDRRWWYTGSEKVPGLTYREEALVVTWAGGAVLTVAPRNGPVVTKDFSDQNRKFVERLVDDVREHPVQVVTALVDAYKRTVAPYFA